MTHLFPHPIFWMAIIASVCLTVAAGAIIDRLLTRRHQHIRTKRSNAAFRRETLPKI